MKLLPIVLTAVALLIAGCTAPEQEANNGNANGDGANGGQSVGGTITVQAPGPNDDGIPDDEETNSTGNSSTNTTAGTSGSP